MLMEPGPKDISNRLGKVTPPAPVPGVGLITHDAKVRLRMWYQLRRVLLGVTGVGHWITIRSGVTVHHSRWSASPHVRGRVSIPTIPWATCVHRRRAIIRQKRIWSRSGSSIREWRTGGQAAVWKRVQIPNRGENGARATRGGCRIPGSRTGSDWGAIPGKPGRERGMIPRIWSTDRSEGVVSWNVIQWHLGRWL